MEIGMITLFVNVPSLRVAERITQAVLEKNLAAWAQIHPVKSRFLWQGHIETTEEIVVSLKTLATSFEEISSLISQHHPYALPALPAIHAVAWTHASEAYLNWAAAPRKD